MAFPQYEFSYDCQDYGLCIGLSLALGVACIGPISGCCLNTAVWLGTAVPALMSGQVHNNLADLWVYWIGTTLGMGCGVMRSMWSSE